MRHYLRQDFYRVSESILTETSLLRYFVGLGGKPQRQNLTMRTSMRRFTRLTNGFSKKIENHIHAISLHYMYYNFVRIHKTLRVTPAMAAGVTKHLWEIEDIVNLLD